jgi:ABC-type ATPase involved in cell division
MNERLIVKNFLCLEDIDLEIKDFLVLIGPQAAGKSLCAKLLYFFRTIINEITLQHTKSALGSPSVYTKILSDKFESFFPKTYWAEQGFHIEYKDEVKTYFKIAKEEQGELSVYLDQMFLWDSQETIQPIQKTVKPINDPQRIRNILEILSEGHIKTFLYGNIFIPAGRSFFSLLQKNIFKFLGTDNSIDPFLVQFGIFYEEIKQTGHELPVEARELVRAILKGDYIPAENLVKLEDGSKITPELLSSGQQEALPLALAFVYIISLRLESDAFTNVYVEEPEAHLFPDAQEQMSRLISFLRHSANQKVTFAITTHSPYILAAFNNLIKAGNMVQQNPALKDAVCRVIPESMHVDIEQFSAYSLENGRAKSIVDGETGLIDPRAIDGVSEGIMEIFNALQDIEFDNARDGE